MIKKIEYTHNEILDYENLGNTLESISNAHYYQLVRINSKDRTKFNPYNINRTDMIKLFGKPNFINYSDNPWWVLNFNDKLFTIETNERQGSVIFKFMGKSSNNVYDREMSKDFTEFTNELFKQIEDV
jgi:hypothetical protein